MGSLSDMLSREAMNINMTDNDSAGDDKGRLSEDDKSNRRIACLIIVTMLTVIIGFMLIGRDMQSLLRWEIGSLLLGLMAYPVIRVVFKGFSDRGYIFGKTVGLAVASYLQWLLSSLRIIAFDRVWCIIIPVVICIAIYLSAYLILKRNGIDKEKENRLAFDSVEKTVEGIAWAEIAFVAAFIFFTWLLGHRIHSVETERVMDYAFMVSLDKTAYMPPTDMWAAGETINYYYYGLYMITYMCKICFVPVREGYSLGLSMIAALTLIYSYKVVKEMLAWVLHKEERGDKSRLLPMLGGVISSAAVTFGGNVHYIVFYILSPMIWDILRLDGEKPTYWFASSTRYIGYIPDNPADRTISEFPSYSFLIGDLHAHVIDIMIVLTITALLAAYVMNTVKGRDHGMMIKSIFCPEVITIAFMIGIAAMTNYWDYPIYYVIAGSVILFMHIYRQDGVRITLGTTALTGVFVYTVATLVKLPFELKFDRMINGVKTCEQHSLVYQWLILWGLPLFTLILYVSFLTHLYGQEKRLNAMDICMLLIGMCGIGLAFMPEIIYVEDIYVNGFPRCNTMFKLTYQAYILLGLMSGYVIVRIISRCHGRVSGTDMTDIRSYLCDRSYIKKAAVSLVLYVLTLGYSVTAYRQWYGETDAWNYKGIDATTGILRDMGEEAAVLDWIRDNTEDGEVILTSDGDSYTTDCLIAALSGHPTVLGWNTHEWLWHNSREYVENRKKDIAAIYTSADSEEIKELVRRYNIAYIYVGPKEYERFGFVDIEGLTAVGSVVYRDNEISSVIIKTDV